MTVGPELPSRGSWPPPTSSTTATGTVVMTQTYELCHMSNPLPGRVIMAEATISRPVLSSSSYSESQIL